VDAPELGVGESRNDAARRGAEREHGLESLVLHAASMSRRIAGRHANPAAGTRQTGGAFEFADGLPFPRIVQ
jgi:hypothetical protein